MSDNHDASREQREPGQQQQAQMDLGFDDADGAAADAADAPGEDAAADAAADASAPDAAEGSADPDADEKAAEAPDASDTPDATGGSAAGSTDGAVAVVRSVYAETPEQLEARRNVVQRGTENLSARVRERSDAVRPLRGAYARYGSPDHSPDRTGVSGQGTHGATRVGSTGRVLDAQGDARAASGRTSIAEDAPTLLLICGSPRKRTSSSLVDLIEAGAREAGVKTQRFELHDKHINPCIGCNACTRTGACAFAGALARNRRGFDDDYLELIGLLDRCDGLAVVAPVYFAGPTAQLKALYDRFQPYWARKYVLGRPFPKRRPAQLFIVGSGGDPHGFDPLVTISRSCLQIAGFEMEKIYNFVGYLSPKDAPRMPTEREQLDMPARERSLLLRQIEQQEGLRKRGVEAGSSFGRLLKRIAQANADGELQEPGDERDAAVEARIAAASSTAQTAQLAQQLAQAKREAQAADAQASDAQAADDAGTDAEPADAAFQTPEATPAAGPDAGQADAQPADAGDEAAG